MTRKGTVLLGFLKGSRVREGFMKVLQFNPQSPYTQIVYTSAPQYLNRDYFETKVSSIWVHGPSGKGSEILKGLHEGSMTVP